MDQSIAGAVLSRGVHPARPWLLGLLYALVLLPLSIAPKVSGNVLSRYMTIEQIVERGSQSIERSPLRARSGTPDVVKIGSRYYSAKPPALSALGVPIYFVLYGLGARFSGPPAQFVLVNLVLTWGLVGVCSGLTLVWLRRLLQVVPIAPWRADLLTLAFGLGSLLLTYGVTFNNHTVAAAAITGSLALTTLERSGLSRFWAGFLAALAATIDLPPGGAVLVALGVWQTARARSVPWAFLAGTLAPALLHTWLQAQVTGTPWPTESNPAFFNYPGSYWNTPEGTWREKGPRWWFALEMVFGPQGWLTVTPALAFGLAGLVLVLCRRGDPLRPLAWVVGGSVLVVWSYYTWGVWRTDFAGRSFGTRHMLPLTPPVYFFAVVALERLRGWWAPSLFALLLAVGAVYAVAGVSDPWSRIESRARNEPALRVLQRFAIYPWSSYDR